MQKKLLPSLLIGAVLAAGVFLAVRYTSQVAERLSGAGALGGTPKLTFIKEPAVIPGLTLTTLDGRTLNSEDWRGKVTLINFWATWCPPCRQEIPDLIKLQDKYRDQLLIIGVSSDTGPTELVAKFAADYKMNYPIVMETEEIRRAFPGVYALPTSFFVDGDLKMVKKHVGLLNAAQTELEARYLAKLPVDAEVEHVAETRPTTLSDSAQATDVPGVALDTLTPGQKTAALKQLNEAMCDCGCGLTIAQCRINDPACTVSLPIAEKIVEDIRAGQSPE
jgi:thiol-disulfide isomerase/thioredoxin